jgi:hypothetical protein
MSASVKSETPSAKEHRYMTIRSTQRFRAHARRIAGIAATALAVAALGTSSAAAAEFDFTGLDVTQDTTQAGAHPDMTVALDFQVPTVSVDFFPDPLPDTSNGLSTVEVALPAGLIGDAGRLPTCSNAQFNEVACPPSSQVGELTVTAVPTFGPPITEVKQVFNLATGPNTAPRLGLALGGVVVLIETEVRTGGDYGLTTTVRNVPGGVAYTDMDLVLWGDPSSHGTGAPAVPFMTNPTDCSGPLAVSARARSYKNPDSWLPRMVSLPAPTGCDQVPFEPSVDVTASNPVADRPSGVKVGISVPDNTDPAGIGSSALRGAVVRLPEGMTINPAVADGRVACSDAQFGKGSAGPSTCPAGSKIGTVELDVPSLREVLPGDIYIGAPQPGNRYRLFLYLEGQGVRVKLEGELRPDPVTGQITAVFADNPQVPFRRIELRFPGGQNAALLMPRDCGARSTVASLTPYSDPTTPRQVSVPMTVTGCPAGADPFAPLFDAGSTSLVAGGDTGFITRFSAPDGHQLLSGLDMELPAGVLGSLRGLPKCSNAAANSNGCSDASLLGSTRVSVGSHESPVTVPGKVFLTEPRRAGDVAGLSIAVPARVGPYDLGTPVVRADITADPNTAKLSVKSDPFPQILEGVQLRIRQVLVELDRPGFMRNPTSCKAKAVVGKLMSTQGAAASVRSPFSVRGCSPLAFKPRLALALKGRRQTTTGRHPGLVARVSQGRGQANIAKAVVGLPKALVLDEANARALCEYTDGTKPDLENHCPKGSVVGSATAVSPLLNRPLRGKVYFVKNVRTDPDTGNQIRTLPMIVAALRGEIAINLKGTSSVRGGRLVSTFAKVPDAPISKFRLAIRGGSNGILVVTENANGPLNLCDKPQIAEVRMRGQNGRPHGNDKAVNTPCTNKRKR